jgi:putative ATP-dependent endonuclease of OLD family
MHLSRLYIENYRSIEKIDLKFERGKNVIVGRNNSGKSNILKAIDLVLGEYSPTYNKSENIVESDFFDNKTDEQIFIWCEIHRETKKDGSLEPINFKEIEKTAFFRVYSDKHNTQEIRVSISDFNSTEKNRIFEFCSEEGQAKIDSNLYGKKWLGGKPYCKASYETEFSDKSKFAIAFTAFKNEENKIQKELVLLYREETNEHWIQGINCNIRNVLIQSAIIPAFRDPKDQLRINQYSWFGKLLKAYIKTDSEELNNAFKLVKDASDELFLGLKEKVAEKEIDIAFPNTTISFQFNPDTKQDIHKSTLIYVNDGFNSELKDKGAGIQSAVIISLYDFYVRNIVHTGSSLLAVEEPELYLHPHGRRVLSNKLSQFIDNGKNQIILTTHSSEFLSSIHETQNIIVAQKNGVATQAHNIYFNSPKRKQILIKKQNAEMFFADAVILTEGADKYFIEEAAKNFGLNFEFLTSDGEIIKLGENWLNDYNVSILNCGGKAELWKYSEILNEISIKHIVTADFDFLRDGLNNYFTKLGFNQSYSDKLNALKSGISEKIQGKYKHLGQLDDFNPLKLSIVEYLESLHQYNIFIFTGELENFYKIKPSLDKEGGVIETMGKLIEDSQSLEEYVEISEYYSMLIHFVKSTFNLERYFSQQTIEVETIINQDDDDLPF